MSLIDIKKLNAEIDQMIANQDVEIKAMKEERDLEYSKKYFWMVTDLAEMCDIADELDRDIWVTTDIVSHYGNGLHKYCYRLRLEREHHVGVGIPNDTYLGRFNIDNDYENEKAKNKIERCCYGLNYNLDDIVKNWASQRESFRNCFEEECLRIIRDKAEKANQNWEFARKDLDEARL